MKAIAKNSKTINSIDTDTICKNKCRYCYVRNARRNKFNAKIKCSECTYDHEILRFKQATIDKLNSVGGIRLFSFSDYKSKHDIKLKMILDDCIKVGLKVKAITKSLEFIDKYHDHKAMNMIHISVDNDGTGIEHKIAKEYRNKYSKTRIRSVILQDSDLQALSFADIHTFNHGNNGFKNYKKNAVIEYSKQYTVCCGVNSCLDCKVKCLTEKQKNIEYINQGRKEVTV